MTIEEYRKSNGQGNKKFKNIILKSVLSVFILISILSICKLSPSTKELIKEELFQTNFNFSYVNNLISKVLPKDNTNSVNDEGIKYKEYTPYLNGVKINFSHI